MTTDDRTNEEKLAEVIEKGGSIIMHKNDFARLLEKRLAGGPCVFDGAKVYEDRFGVVEEGKMICMSSDFG